MAEYGECVVERVFERIEIGRADPTTLVSAELVAEVELGFGDNGIECAEGLLRLAGTSRTVVYRLGDYLPNQRAYAATKISDTDDPPASLLGREGQQ